MNDAGSSMLERLSRQSIVQGSKSFSAAARLFPKGIRTDAVMLYAWCRHADDVIDGQTAGFDQKADFREGQQERLKSLRDSTAEALSGRPEKGGVFEALHLVVAKHSIPHIHPMQLIDGFEMDAEDRPYDTLEDTLDYCYHVAGVVGVMMSMIMGARAGQTLDRASDLGVAFQLTNIARDVIDDARAGRCYIPSQWLIEAGLSEIDPDDTAQWPKLHALACRLLDVAEPHYQSAHEGLAALPWRSAWAIAAARRIYRDIGRQLRSAGPTAWRHRVSTTRTRKVFLLLISLKDVMATRGMELSRGPDRKGLYQRPGSV